MTWGGELPGSSSRSIGADQPKTISLCITADEKGIRISGRRVHSLIPCLLGGQSEVSFKVSGGRFREPVNANKVYLGTW
jgi:hypothetical protein